jgi:hypothetical protein
MMAMPSFNQQQFVPAFESWHKMLRAAEPRIKLKVFENVTDEAVDLVSKGLDKIETADRLQEMALNHGLVDALGLDKIQEIIAGKFDETLNEAHAPELEDANGSIVELDADHHEIGPLEELELREAATQAPPVNGPEDYGLPPIRNVAPAAPAAALLQIFSKREFIAGFTPPDYLIDGIFQRGYVYALTAPTGHGKSALALLIARLVGRQEGEAHLGPHAVDRGKVIYFAGENADDLRMRVIGDDAQSKRDGSNDNISFIPGVFSIDQMRVQLAAEAERMSGIDLVIVDTSAAFFLGNDELNNTQMGAHARTLRTLTTLPGHPTVIVLCHPIKHAADSSQLLPRGGGAFLAEIDGNMTLWKRNDTLLELYWHGKLRGPGFEPMNVQARENPDHRVDRQQGASHADRTRGASDGPRGRNRGPCCPQRRGRIACRHAGTRAIGRATRRRLPMDPAERRALQIEGAPRHATVVEKWPRQEPPRDLAANRARQGRSDGRQYLDADQPMGGGMTVPTAVPPLEPRPVENRLSFHGTFHRSTIGKTRNMCRKTVAFRWNDCARKRVSFCTRFPTVPFHLPP